MLHLYLIYHLYNFQMEESASLGEVGAERSVVCDRNEVVQSFLGLPEESCDK